MSELGNMLPGSEGFVEVEQNTKGKHPNTICLNCGTPLLDSFCHHCGQKDIPQRQTLGELWTNFISSFWSYEGKFFLTTKYLVTRPGFLAMEYNKGKRESFYHPARMYVFISFVFFLIFFSFGNTDNEISEDKKKNVLKETTDELKKTKVDSILKVVGKDSAVKQINSIKDSIKSNRKKNNGIIFNFDDVKYNSVKEYDSLQQMKPIQERDGWFKKIAMTRAIELNNRYKDNDSEFGKDFTNAFSENFSKVLFYLLPIFALLLKLLYIRKDFFYSEHLVFSIYYYNFFYLAGSLQLLVQQVPQLNWLGNIIALWIMLYLLFAMKRMYNQGWGKTILKYLIFVFLFFVCVGIGLAINAIAILMFI
jgi:hypothetical protein